MSALKSLKIVSLDAFHIAIPLVNPYHLSKVYGTQTHSDVIIVRIMTDSGEEGWGEADPGGVLFTGDTGEAVMQSIREEGAERIIGCRVDDWVENGDGLKFQGSVGAAFDVAVHDALAKSRHQPLWALLGEKRREKIDSLWPTSSGTAEDDLEIIQPRLAQGFRTFMLKMGSRPVDKDIERVIEVTRVLPEDVKIMVDANQGWEIEEAMTFVEGITDVPLVLIEQPVVADDHEGLKKISKISRIPVSVDESLQTVEDARRIALGEIASVFSIKVSKNGGLRAGLEIGRVAKEQGILVMMNSMLELGITQSASLHLGCVLDCLIDCGHAYMSTLRMSDDVTDFSNFVSEGKAHLPSGTGLGIQVNESKIMKYLKEEYHV
ncbi:MAG: enolase C-terminal domain-like protein [SAR324 cluster bacterium]|nr:enolase C-terminal domain-like protein [SAR324 cluster bacterium]